MVSVDELTEAERMVILAMTSGFLSLGNFPLETSKIRRITGMSVSILLKALRELVQKGVIECTSGGKYRFAGEEKQRLLIPLKRLYNDYLLKKAERISREISRFKAVEEVLLLGSLAMGKGSYNSDIDLLIILRNHSESLEKRISNLISKLSIQLGVPVEPSFLSIKGAQDHLRIQASPDLRPHVGLLLFKRSRKLCRFRGKIKTKRRKDQLSRGEKIAVFLRVAERHLKDAESAFKHGVFHDCVYHSASAAENAADALILWFGGAVPHLHRDSETLEHIALHLKPKLLKDGNFKRMLKDTKELERHVVKSKYPVEVEDGVFIPPEEFYQKDDAETMLNKARSVVEMVKLFLRV